MKKTISIILTLMICLGLTACGNENKHEGQAKTPSGSSVMHGRNYQEVINDFKENGFTNIKTEKIEDLIFGWLTSDGEVEEVLVGGDVNYSPDEWIDADTEIIIRYHTFPEETTETTETTEEVALENLTIENCPELSYILKTKDEFDPKIKSFATKYKGRYIEFDGHTAYVTPNGNYKTRFDYLIYYGDYDTTISGPNFQIKDVNYYDLNLVGGNVPDTFGTGINIHIIAEVIGYNSNSGLFEIEPIEISIRTEPLSEKENTTEKQTTTERQTTTEKQTTEKQTTQAIYEPEYSVMVWIPQSGSKYHSHAGCSGMKNPSQVSLESAQNMGYTPCSRCY